MYHFLLKGKPHQRIDLLITTSVNIYKTKKNPIVMKICFSEGKLIKQFRTPPPLSKRTPFSTNPPPYFWAIFSEPSLCPNLKNKNPPNFRGEESGS